MCNLYYYDSFTACVVPSINTGKRQSEINRGWTFCKKQSKSIEVSYKNDDGEVTLAKVHFRAPESVKQNLLESISLVFIPGI